MFSRQDVEDVAGQLQRGGCGKGETIRSGRPEGDAKKLAARKCARRRPLRTQEEAEELENALTPELHGSMGIFL